MYNRKTNCQLHQLTFRDKLANIIASLVMFAIGIFVGALDLCIIGYIVYYCKFNSNDIISELPQLKTGLCLILMILIVIFLGAITFGAISIAYDRVDKTLSGILFKAEFYDAETGNLVNTEYKTFQELRELGFKFKSDNNDSEEFSEDEVPDETSLEEDKKDQ